MARKIFAAVGGGYASLFYGTGQVDRNSRWMCIATGVAYSQNIVLGYDGTLPRHSPSFATMFLQIRNEPFHSYLLPVVDDCLHRIGLRNQTAVVTIQTIGPSHVLSRPSQPAAVWTWIDGLENAHMGESGILLAVVVFTVLPADRCFL
jgi:hypothetical protein